MKIKVKLVDFINNKHAMRKLGLNPYKVKYQADGKELYEMDADDAINCGLINEDHELTEAEIEKNTFDNKLEEIKSKIEYLMFNEIDHAGYDDNIIDALARLHLELKKYFGE